jgi:murein DD-endopeptidase MepM/ murein hydrolase activator NlpD
VIDDFKTGVALGYTVSDGPGPTPQPPEPERNPHARTEAEPMPARDIDLKLTARGVTFNFVKPTPGTQYWRITKAEWMQDAAAQVGPDHHILGQLLKDLIEQGDVPMRVDWPSGTTTIYSKHDDPNASYNYDYGMSPSLNEFSIRVDDGKPSDSAAGIGMGYGGNPKAHSTTWITFELVTVPEPSTPIPPIRPPHEEIETGLVTATDGLNLRAGPGTTFPVLGTLRFGSSVLFDHSQDDWLHVVEGYVSAQYVGSELPPLFPEAPILPVTPGGLVHPLRGSIITQNFYEESAAYLQFGFSAHNGTDFGGVVAGTPILAMADGVIFRAEFDAGYGNHVLIAHDQKGCYSLYAHCSELLAIIGASVGAGEAIGLLGSTGNSSGPHLHFEIRKMNPDGSYSEGTPMPKGRLDPRTWAFLHGLTL